MWNKITDYKRKLTLKDHGRILKVGKYKFARINIKGGWDFWHHGFTDIAWIKDEPIYKYKDGNWYKKI